MRITGGLLGLLILFLIYYHVFIEHQPLFYPEEGINGLFWPFAGGYFAVAFIAYAIGANKFLRKIAPQFATKQNKDEVEDEIKNKNDM